MVDVTLESVDVLIGWAHSYTIPSLESSRIKKERKKQVRVLKALTPTMCPTIMTLIPVTSNVMHKRKSIFGPKKKTGQGITLKH